MTSPAEAHSKCLVLNLAAVTVVSSMCFCVWIGQLGTGGGQTEATGPSFQVFVTAGVRHLLHVSRETCKGKKGKH